MMSFWRAFLKSLLKNLFWNVIAYFLLGYIFPGRDFNFLGLLYILQSALQATIDDNTCPIARPAPQPVPSTEPTITPRSLQDLQQHLSLRLSTALERENHRLATEIDEETVNAHISQVAKYLGGSHECLISQAMGEAPKVVQRQLATNFRDFVGDMDWSSVVKTVQASERQVAQHLESFHMSLFQFASFGFFDSVDENVNERITAFRQDEGLMLILVRTALVWYSEHDETKLLFKQLAGLLAQGFGCIGYMDNDRNWDGVENRYGHQWRIMLDELCCCLMEIDKVIKTLAKEVYGITRSQLSNSLKRHQLLGVRLDFFLANLDELIQFKSEPIEIEHGGSVGRFLSAYIKTLDPRLLLRKNKTKLIASAMEQMEILREELSFLIIFLGDKPLQSDEFGKVDSRNLLDDIEAVTNQTGRLCYLIFMDKMDNNLKSFLSDLFQKFEFINLKIKKFVEDSSTEILWRNLSVDEFSVSFADKPFLEHLQELLEHKYKSIFFVKNEIGIIHTELISVRSLIKDKLDKSSENEDLNDLVAHFSGIIDIAEYLVDSLIVQNKPHWYYANRFSHVLKEIDLAKKRLRTIKEVSKGTIRVPERAKEYFPTDTPVLSNVKVEFSLEETVKEQLLSEKRRLKLISIVGMPGLGKTTLARKIYDDLVNLNKFDVLAWCTVSQAYQRRGLLLDILKSIDNVADETDRKSDEDLAYSLYQKLNQKRYIIVMDDIWTIEPWQDLSISFPDNGTGSRVVFTSRNEELLQSYDRWPHTTYKLPFLSDDACWYLLRENAFQNEQCPVELENVGKEIAVRCEGLPLTVNLIAGVLARMERKQESWEQVARSLISYIGIDSSMCEMVLEQSYVHLPSNLKPCFLYCGSFPQRKTIEVQKLMRLWIAEGFIVTSGQDSLERAAENCLMQLISRSLLLVNDQRSNGSVKSCRIHALLHDFCLKKAREENFLKVIDSSFAIYESHRRLAIVGDDNFPATHNSRSFGPHVRSLTISRSHDLYLSSFIPYTSFHFTGSKLLKVLDLESIETCGSFPNEIGKLVLLRYLAIRGRFYGIPSRLSNLRNLETLIVVAPLVDLPDAVFGMWKLKNLHLKPLSHVMYFGAPTRFVCARQKFIHLNNVRTLMILRINCIEAEETLRLFPCLYKLKCFVDQIMIDSTSRFPAMDFLSHLEILSATYMTLQPPTVTSLIFPPSLKQLTLSYFYLPWKEMSAVGRLLPKLEVLKLLNFAFKGEEWDMFTYAVEFPKLKFLKLQSLDINRWIIESCDQFPSLQRLVVQDCKALDEIPDIFADVRALQVIQLQGCSDSAVQSAFEIKELQQDYGNEDFKVFIRTSGF